MELGFDVVDGGFVRHEATRASRVASAALRRKSASCSGRRAPTKLTLTHGTHARACRRRVGSSRKAELSEIFHAISFDATQPTRRSRRAPPHLSLTNRKWPHEMPSSSSYSIHSNHHRLRHDPTIRRQRRRHPLNANQLAGAPANPSAREEEEDEAKAEGFFFFLGAVGRAAANDAAANNTASFFFRLPTMSRSSTSGSTRSSNARASPTAI